MMRQKLPLFGCKPNSTSNGLHVRAWSAESICTLCNQLKALGLVFGLNHVVRLLRLACRLAGCGEAGGCAGCAQQMAYTLASKTCGQYTVYASLPYIVLSCQARTCYVHTAPLTWWLFFLFIQFATISFVPWQGGCFSLHA
jgi:hypothetical protein